ncbi:hypothetical protein Tco_0725758 [Tanacetum coccineum]|uniref:DUF4283 domain-containing protein n=1 Tax=Tanacetum coccineum TaxID=301880 RepID=A0ABQ4YG04_9ASTR
MDVDSLLQQLRKIRVGEDYLRVYFAFDRRTMGDRRTTEGTRVPFRWTGSKTRWNSQQYQSMNRVETRFGTRDNRRYSEVLNEKNNIKNTKTSMEDKGEKKENQGLTGKKKTVVEDQRTIELNDGEIDIDVLNRSLIGETKKLCYLVKLPWFCEEQGLPKVEVKLLGGLEVMLIFETAVTAYSILNDGEHGIRRWVHNLRKWNENYKPSGRLTWVNVIGVPVGRQSKHSYWKSSYPHHCYMFNK